jgi:hypothetical protein
VDADIIEEFRRSIDGLIGRGSGAVGWSALAELGWPDLLIEDVTSAAELLFPAQARHLVHSPGLDALALVGLGLDPDPLALGVLYPVPKRASASHVAVSRSPVEVGDELAVRGVAARTVLDPVPDRCVVSLETGSGPAVAIVDGVHRLRPQAHDVGLAPSSGWQVLDGAVRVADVVAVSTDATTRLARLQVLLRFAVAHELAEIGRHTLQMACDHVRTRHQFGRPLGSFQAVKHRLARAAVHAAAAETTLASAANALRSGDDPYLSVLVARIQSGVSATESVAHAQQLFGAMGYSWELPLHQYVRRAMLIDTIAGPTELLTRELGRFTLTAGSLPRIAVFTS